MGDQYLGEIRMVAFPYAPTGWALCNGQRMSVQANQALFALLGGKFGGDMQTYFNLPDFQGRIPLHAGAGANLPSYDFGASGGAAAITLTQNQMPAHTHVANFVPSGSGTASVSVSVSASAALGNTSSPAGNYIAGTSQATSHTGSFVASPAPNTLGQLAGVTATISGLSGGGVVTNALAGSNQPVPIEPPYLAVYFLIATEGVYPSRS